MLHRLEELDLGNNELYSLVSLFVCLISWALGNVFTHKMSRTRSPISLSLYCPSNLASLENSFHLLSHSWEEDHLL